MGKKVGGVSWRSVTLEGLPMDGAALDGLIGLEECTDYDLDKNAGGKRKRKVRKKVLPKTQNASIDKVATKPTPQTPNEPAVKKQKLLNGFVVEICRNTKPSTGNIVQAERIQDPSRTKKHKKKKSKKKKEKVKAITEPDKEKEIASGESTEVKDMQAWSQFQVPEEILRALADQGFEKPTKIQELCLPPAMLGRRDILGAAETGSGKTLAFGIPILAGIMKLKEDELAGKNVYDLQYKKTSIKKTKEPTKPLDIKQGKQINKENKPKETVNVNDQESSEKEDSTDEGIESNEESEEDKVDEKSQDAEETDKKEYDSDNSDNYVHLSDLIDSDNLEDSSDEENDIVVDPLDESENEEFGDEESESGDEEISAEQVGEGIGCVKVIDDVELPPHTVVRTGRPLYALVITPTRELAMQISKHMVAAARYTGIRVAVLVGGMAQVKQERLLAASPEVVVCTPGRLWELLQQGNPHLQQVDNIKFLAIDETDRMVERNHFEELQPLLERLNADERRRGARQNFVMSATLTMTHDLPSHLKGKKVTKRGKIINRKVQKMTPQQKVKRLVTMLGMTDPKIVDLTASNHGTAETLTECRITCALEQKDDYLFYILRTHPGRTIVFCNSIGCVKRLAQLFTLLKCHPLPLHAAMPQRQRLKNLERFRDDSRGVLVATDVAARGLDIPDVDHVIHYQVPRTAENYVHRSGRTARANKEGLTILMMEPGEAFLYSKLCHTLNKTAELSEFPVPSRALAAMKQCLALARDVERAALAGKRRAQESGWLERAARECDLVVDEDFVPMKKKLDETSDAPAKQLQLMRKQLDSMLSRPLFPQGFSYRYPTLNEPAPPAAQENALQAMKRALETGAAKRAKRTSKNAPLLELARRMRPTGRKDGDASEKGASVAKKKKKKFYKPS